jgi:thiamine biosynthesis lipoprotein
VNRRSFIGSMGAGVLALRFPRRDEQLVERWSWVMGQPVHLQLFTRSTDQGLAAAAAALAELRRVEHRLSLFDDTSDLVELNRHAGRRAIRVGRDLTFVLAAGLRLEQATQGAFNPAIEPLMRVWGFRQPRRSEPTPAEISEARESVQAAQVELASDRAALPSAHTRLDLGGIAVGYGLDRAAAVLRGEGVSRAFLDISGDCIALGAPPGQEGWLVEIASPDGTPRQMPSTRLRDAALATSANTMSFVRYGRAVRGHVMNPETGWPADALTQVSVVAGSGIEADALSTAMLVSGKPAVGVMRYYRV